MTLRLYQPRDEDAVVALWTDVLPDTAPRNDPRAELRRKRGTANERIVVALDGADIVGTVVVGFDGTRGWLHRLAVSPARRRRGVGRALVAEAERWLSVQECPKLNLQVRGSNADAVAFYARLGFRVEDRTSLGKELASQESPGVVRTVVAYTIYHSPNAYLGMELARRRLAGLPVRIERRPLHVPKTRGVKVADLVGGRKAPVHAGYHREDCARWAAAHGIDFRPTPPETFAERAARWQRSPYAREELPARAYFAACGTGAEDALDMALFHAAWVDGRDVNDEDVVRDAARTAGLDAGALLTRALTPEVSVRLDAALAGFERDGCPGVPTFVVGGERWWGKDRVDWLVRGLERAEGIT
jgi:2-hydroxychromene-2-carboxylate isomerase/GNAT superfamily N-acetyltransferase